MKQYQPILMQLLKEKFLAIKVFTTLILIFMFFSCTSIKNLHVKKYDSSQKIINNLLEYYVKKYDSICLINKLVNLENPEVIFNKNIYSNKNTFNNCIDVTNDSIGNESYPLIAKDYLSSTYYDTIFLSKINNPKVYEYEDLKLKKAENIENFKTNKEWLETGKIKLFYSLKEEIRLRKYLSWDMEHNIPLLMVSKPIISDNRKLAAVYVTRVKEGDFLWFLKKEKNKWVVFCEKRLSYH